MDCNTLGSSVLHYLLYFAQIHDHRVDDAIQPSHPLLPSSFAFNLSQDRGSFLASRLFAFTTTTQMGKLTLGASK